MRTIRMQLLAAYLVSLFLPLATLAAVGAVTWFLLFPASGTLDLNRLMRYAADLKPIVETRLQQEPPAAVHQWLSGRLRPELPSYLRVQVVDPNGVVLADTEGLPGEALSMLTLYQLMDPPGRYGDRYHAVEVLHRADGSPLGLMIVSVPESATAVIHLGKSRPQDRIGSVLLASVPLLSFLASVSLFWRLGSAMVRPLQALSAAVSRVAEGDLTLEVPVERRDEIGQLALSVQGMVRRLRAAHERAEAAERARRYWVAAASHDLRTPLTVILAQVETLLRTDRTPEHVRSRLHTVYQKAEQLREMVHGLFELASLDAQALEWPRRETDLAELIRRETAHLLPAIEGAGMAIEVDLPEHPCPVLVAPDKIQRAFQNLVNNAIRYGAFGRLLIVRMRRPRPGWWRVEVEDRGPGLDEARIPLLFEHIAPGGNASGEDRGTGGLGLTIVKEIIRRHDGQVGAKNIPDSGACVWFELPALR